jgi:hypothetical protein
MRKRYEGKEKKGRKMIGVENMKNHSFLNFNEPIPLEKLSISRHPATGIVKSKVALGWSSVPSRGRNFFPYSHVQTNSGAHSAFNRMDTGGGKALQHNADHSLLCRVLSYI